MTLNYLSYSSIAPSLARTGLRDGGMHIAIYSLPGTVGRMTLEGCRGHLGNKMSFGEAQHYGPSISAGLARAGQSHSDGEQTLLFVC